MSEILKRLIGPIPERTIPATGEPFAHPGGPAPAWGGYAPIRIDCRADLLRSDIAELAATLPGATVWRAHTSGTILLRVAPGHAAATWYVACPARDTARAVSIGVDAIRDAGTSDGLGLTAAEHDEAERVAAGKVSPWAYQLGDREISPFARARFEALGVADEPICGGPAEDGPNFVARGPRPGAP